MSESYPQLLVESVEQWRRWLVEHHDTSPWVWVVTWKKGHGAYVGYDAIVEEALCFGWVDSLPRPLDEDRTRRLLTPRKPGSSWSRVNRQRVERLLAQGRMAPAGLAVVQAAQRNGAWSRLDAVEDLVEPDDLRAALDADPTARTQ